MSARRRVIQRNRGVMADFDPVNLKNLDIIVKNVPRLEVVISSSWRNGYPLEQLREFLYPHIPRKQIVGITPNLDSLRRDEEIATWLTCNIKPHEMEIYAAIDDDAYDMDVLGKNFFRTDSKLGLTRSVAKSVVRHFKNTVTYL